MAELFALQPQRPWLPRLSRPRRVAWGGALATVLLLAAMGEVAAQGTNDDRLRRIDGRSIGCSQKQDVLDRIRCQGSMRVGVRGNYPGFGVRTGVAFTGYDVAVAKLIGEGLGVAVELVEVTSQDRIRKLASGRVDMIVATMAHTVTRQREIRVVRPHYYSTYTVMVGAKTSALQTENELAGQQVCAPLGHFSNLRLTELRASVSLYNNSARMMDALISGVCRLVLHDATFLRAYMHETEFARRFEEKVRFDSAPWGIAIAHEDTDGLYQAVSKIIAEAHRASRLTEFAEAYGLETAFLREQQADWSVPECWRDGAPAEPCFLPPYEDEVIR
jgi:ABC-type amino acid transport substrate-binding protein